MVGTSLRISSKPPLNRKEIDSLPTKPSGKKAANPLRFSLSAYISPSSSRESRQQEVSDISRQLKALARELKCPVIALSQLSRQVEQRKGKPMLSDLRESGAIEQDADIVAFLHREDYQNKEKEAETNGLTEIVVAKHRNGATADISLVFEKQYSRFSDYYTGPENQNSGEGLRI